MNDTHAAAESASEDLTKETGAKTAAAEPRIEDSRRLYHATTERRSDVSSIFAPPRRQRAAIRPSYKAFKKRPAGFAGPFALPRNERVEAAPTYFAMSTLPSEASEIDATADSES